jgi:hypothetical protein
MLLDASDRVVCAVQGLAESNEELRAAQADLGKARAAETAFETEVDSAPPVPAPSKPEAKKPEPAPKPAAKAKETSKDLPIVNAVKGALDALRLGGSPSSSPTKSPPDKPAAAKADNDDAILYKALKRQVAESATRQPPSTGIGRETPAKARDASDNGAAELVEATERTEIAPAEASVAEPPGKEAADSQPDASKAWSHVGPPPEAERRTVVAPTSKPPPVPTAPVRSRGPRSAAPPPPPAAATPPPPRREQVLEPPLPSSAPPPPTEKKEEEPPAKAPTLQDIVNNARQRGAKVFTDYAPRPGTLLRVLVDKRRTVFASDQNEHHMQLKIGLNKWTRIYNVELKKVTELPGEDDIYAAVVQLPDDLFRFDFVIEDFRTSKVCGCRM